MERKEKEESEAARLQAEIEELRHQKDEKAQLARQEAERVAQLKLAEIEKLKREHDERLKLIQQRIDVEELQKSRLLEEVDNLKKIRELREEKARLATELERDVEISDIQKLIEERELEVTRLTKQIEYDDAEARNYATPLHSSKPVSASVPDKVPRDEAVLKVGSSSAGAPAVLPPLKEKKEVKEPKAETTKSGKHHRGVLDATTAGVGAGVGVIGAGIAAVGTSASGVNKSASGPGSLTGNKNTTSVGRNGSGSDSGRRNSLRDSFKKIFKSEKPEKSETKPKETASAPVKQNSQSKAVNIAHQPAAAEAGSSSEETYSVYEEVSDAEYERHKDDPNYFEVSDEEFEKHRASVKE